MSIQLTAEAAVAGSAVPRYELTRWRERFGVIAGITGRGENGFDLGLWSSGPVGETMARWRALRGAIPGFGGWILAHQVHGTRVLRHESATGWVTLEGADGHVTSTPGILLLVTVADCIPIYLVDPVRRVAGLLHSGWRGTAQGILSAGVETMVEDFGCSAGNILMHCGVGICSDCYEVGSEVMEGCRMPHPGPGPWHLDLRAVLAEQGRALGLAEISTSQLCSSHDRPKFYSHRASRGADGRMVAYLGWPRTSSSAIDATPSPG